jgi:hypothetical protein
VIRRWEVALGVLATGLGLYGVLYAVFFPSYLYERGGEFGRVCGMQSWLQAGIGPASIVYLVVTATLYVLVAVLAVRDSDHPTTRTIGALWLVAVSLIAVTALGFFGIGLLLAPGSLAGVLTAIVGSVRRTSPSGPAERPNRLAS